MKSSMENPPESQPADLLPDDEPMPRWTVLHDRMGPGVDHFVWLNTFVHRFHTYAVRNYRNGLPVSMKRFAEEEAGFNSPSTFRHLGGAVTRLIGYKWKRKHHPDFSVPPEMTPELADKFLAEWKLSHQARPEHKALAARIGRTMLDKDMQAFDLRTGTVIPLDMLLQSAEESE